MVYSLTYRRPSYVSSARGSVNGDLKPKSLNESVSSGSTYCAFGIPEALSFDRIISGGTCPVSSSRRSRQFFNPGEHLVFHQESQHILQSYSIILFKLSIRIHISQAC